MDIGGEKHEIPHLGLVYKTGTSTFKVNAKIELVQYIYVVCSIPLDGQYKNCVLYDLECNSDYCDLVKI